MTSEELEGHLIKLRSKGLNTRGVIINLLSYCRRIRFTDENKSDFLVNNSHKRVQQIIAQLGKLNFDFNDEIYAMVMDFFVKCGDIESALYMKSKISKDFEIDYHKII